MFTLIARTGLFIGIFLVISAGALALALPTDTDEFVISVLTVGIGVFLSLFSTFALFIERKRQ
ncbi:hypothetical protein [Natronoglycomyces albus]|uniref:Uncharacterized protein n=1 Tax=Natronoglycomyces albus TaxID=2811108 RepID=A0A895XGW2_9ACTN|nr:hypothetical protein [Natronoglycomyces albus]QSB05091.1 hypothetical protein JQS30_15230 [Natronoglycomyces albus]